MIGDPPISGPTTVSEGSTSPIRIKAPNADHIVVTFPSTAETKKIPVGTDGTAQFELPSNVSDGDTIVVRDAAKFSDSIIIQVGPASSSPP